MKKEEMFEKTKEFLKEYELLCQKYKIGLNGCGCCGSPWLSVLDENDFITPMENINYSEKDNCITCQGKKIQELNVQDLIKEELWK